MSPVTVLRIVSPVTVLRIVSPVRALRFLSPVPVPRIVSPVPVLRIVSPVTVLRLTMASVQCLQSALGVEPLTGIKMATSKFSTSQQIFMSLRACFISLTEFTSQLVLY